MSQDYANQQPKTEDPLEQDRKVLRIKQIVYLVSGGILGVLAIFYMVSSCSSMVKKEPLCDLTGLIPLLHDFTDYETSQATITRKQVFGTRYIAYPSSTLKVKFRILDSTGKEITDQCTIKAALKPITYIKDSNNQRISITEPIKLREYFDEQYINTSNPALKVINESIEGFKANQEGYYVLFVVMETPTKEEITTELVSLVDIPERERKQKEDWGSAYTKNMLDSNTVISEIYGPFTLTAENQNIETRIALTYPPAQLGPTDLYGGRMSSVGVSGTFIRASHFQSLADKYKDHARFYDPTTKSFDWSQKAHVRRFLNYLDEGTKVLEDKHYEEFSFVDDNVYKYRSRYPEDTVDIEAADSTFILHESGQYYLLVEVELPRNREVSSFTDSSIQIKEIAISQGGVTDWLYFMIGSLILLWMALRCGSKRKRLSMMGGIRRA